YRDKYQVHQAGRRTSLPVLRLYLFSVPSRSGPESPGKVRRKVLLVPAFAEGSRKLFHEALSQLICTRQSPGDSDLPGLQSCGPGKNSPLHTAPNVLLCLLSGAFLPDILLEQIPSRRQNQKTVCSKSPCPLHALTTVFKLSVRTSLGTPPKY